MAENVNAAEAAEMQAEQTKKLYELMFAVPGSATAEEAKEALARTKKEIVTLGGKVENVEEWGKRDLAYPIRKEYQGYYFVVHYYLETGKSGEMDDFLRLDKMVMRHLVVIRPENVPAVDYSGVKTGYSRPPEVKEAMLGEELEEKEDKSMDEDIMKKSAPKEEPKAEAEEEDEQPKKKEKDGKLDQILDDLGKDLSI